MAQAEGLDSCLGDQGMVKIATFLHGDQDKPQIPRAQEEKLKVIPFLVAEQSLQGRVSKASWWGGGEGEGLVP